jgi:hypothetical protein
MISVLKWIIFIPFQFGSTLLAYIVAPVAVLFRKEYSLKGTWFWWTTTPNTDLRGDPDHQERWEHKNCYLQFLTWIWRNPAVNFQREYLGVDCQESKGDYVETIGNRNAQDEGGSFIQFVKRNGRVRAWMIFCLWPYPFKKDKAFRILLGWKTWDTFIKNPLQYTFRITPWKSR